MKLYWNLLSTRQLGTDKREMYKETYNFWPNDIDGEYPNKYACFSIFSVLQLQVVRGVASLYYILVIFTLPQLVFTTWVYFGSIYILHK